MSLFCLAILLIICNSVYSWDIKTYNATANPSSIVTTDNNLVRFTILTDNLIRLEYANQPNKFENGASVTVVNRYNPERIDYTVNKTSNSTIIETKYLTLTYHHGHGSFNTKSLTISGSFPQFNNMQFTYIPSNNINDDNSWSRNLFGTLGDLGESNGSVPLNCSIQYTSNVCVWGVIGRDGYALIDDTKIAMFDNESNWLSYEANVNKQDWYFFGHGLDFQKALKDFQLITGTTPMLPRYAYGSMHSRWYDYSDLSIKQIIQTMISTELPLDVVVFDMNWHLNFNNQKPWGAYTWNNYLFPDPNNTQAWFKQLGLRSTANLHDAAGICYYEEYYTQAAVALDVTNGKNITANFSDFNYMMTLEDIILKPIEQGVSANNNKYGFDFWWIDGVDGDNPSHLVSGELWSNYIRSTDHLRRGENVRGMVISRYGGYGTHRYPIGFSGDVDFHPNHGGHYNGLGHTWSSLGFEPYYSATSANVGYGWSHDLLGAAQDYELNTRWIQWGAMSTIFRTHGAGKTQGNCADSAVGCPLVDIWTHPYRNMNIERNALQFRSELLPYIYNSTYYDTYVNGINLIHPMYYDYPMSDNSYVSTVNFSQYMFGNNIIVKPVTDRSNDGGNFNLTNQTIWIPNTDSVGWYEMHSGKYYNNINDQLMERWFDLSEIPIYIRGNGIIVKQPFDRNKLIGRADAKAYDFLRFEIYPSKFSTKFSGDTQLYEDDGYTYDYLKNSNVITKVEWNFDTNTFLFNSSIRSEGNYNGFIEKRTYSIRIYNVLPPTKVMCNNEEIEYNTLWFGVKDLEKGWFYNGKDMSVTVNCIEMNTANINHVSMQFNDNWVNDLKLTDGMRGIINRAILCKQGLDPRNVNYGVNGPRNNITQIAVYSTLLSQIGNNYEETHKLVAKFQNLYEDAMKQVNLLPESQTGWKRKHYCTQLLGTI